MGAPMSELSDTIETSAEYAENAVLPALHEVHLSPNAQSATPTQIPSNLQGNGEEKSAARWAYERLILYIQNFEKQLGADQEVAMGFTGSDAGVMRIEGLGYFDPDIVTFYGGTDTGTRTQLIQHVAQLNVMLMALPKPTEQAEPTRIGFELAKDLETTA